MVITDPLSAPSKRFFNVIGSYFSNQEFNIKRDHFEKTYENRIEKIYPTFFKWGHLVTVSFYWNVSFIMLEKVMQKMEGTKRRTLDATIGSSLTNYDECRKKRVEDRFDLFDQNARQYDDFSINKAAGQLINSYETFIDPFFKRFSSLATLEKEINKIPIVMSKYMNIKRHLVSGILLAKAFRNESFDLIYEAYEDYLLTSQFSDKEDFLQELQSTREYVVNNQIVLA